jgi:hypothetical protein
LLLQLVENINNVSIPIESQENCWSGNLPLADVAMPVRESGDVVRILFRYGATGIHSHDEHVHFLGIVLVSNSIEADTRSRADHLYHKIGPTQPLIHLVLEFFFREKSMVGIDTGNELAGVWICSGFVDLEAKTSAVSFWSSVQALERLSQCHTSKPRVPHEETGLLSFVSFISFSIL